jgi:hypothetical protein
MIKLIIALSIIIVGLISTNYLFFKKNIVLDQRLVQAEQINKQWVNSMNNLQEQLKFINKYDLELDKSDKMIDNRYVKFTHKMEELRYVDKNFNTMYDSNFSPIITVGLCMLDFFNSSSKTKLCNSSKIATKLR